MKAKRARARNLLQELQQLPACQLQRPHLDDRYVSMKVRLRELGRQLRQDQQMHRS